MINQIRKNLLTTTSLNVFTYLIPLVVTPYFLRVAGTENFGLLNLAQTIIQYLILFVGFNLDVTISSEIAIIKNDIQKLREIFWKVMHARIMLLLIASAIFAVIFIAFKLYNEDTFLLSLTYIGLIGYAITPLWFYQGTENFLHLFLFVAIGKILFAIIVFTCITQPNEYWYYTLGLSLSQLISGILLLLFPIIKYGIKPAKVSAREIWYFLKQKFPLFKGGTIINFCMNINISILGIILSLESFGLYMAANKLILVIFTLITLPLNQSLCPYISRSITEDFKLAITKIQHVMIPGLTYLALGTCCCLFMLSKPIIFIMLGPKFLDAEVPFRLMVFSLFANVITNVVILQLFIKLGLLKKYARVSQVASVIGILLTVAFTSMFDVNGAAISWLLFEFFLFIYSMIELKRSGVGLIVFKSLHPKVILSFLIHKKVFLLRK